MSDTSTFYKRVYSVAQKIPVGRVTSYGRIARYLGAARSSRMVGYAMNAAHDKPEIPAHRVVNRNGVLTGKHHFPGTDLMQQLLENEGICVEDDRVQDFKKHLWDPTVELEEEPHSE